MPRKKTELGADADARIVQLMRAGGTVDSIQAVLAKEGVKTSRSTIGRRVNDLKTGRIKAAIATVGPITQNGASSDADHTNGSVPDDSHIKDPLDRLLAKVDRMAIVAEEAADFAGLAQAARLSAQLLESKRKSAPLPTPDPNESPDMVKLGAEVAERLEKMIAKAVGQ